MNVFILSTGRCGSMSFSKACQHITNYTSAHESRLKLIGEQRLAYPDNHIESDNRLSWYLGRLEERYGNDAFYVYLNRNKNDIAKSYARRSELGIIKAYQQGILLGGEPSQTGKDIAFDYVNTVESNIRLFLKDKTNKMDFKLENAKSDFSLFWQEIGANGNLNHALLEWNIRHNAS